MKKFLPLILLGVGILVIVGVFFFVRSRGGEEEIEQEDISALIEVPLEDSPIASLTPRSDGHWLDMVVGKLGKFDAYSMDYELLYKLADGRTQGVPGSVQLKGQESVERELLLGSESSGKFRYDEGVETGTFTLRFRNEKGKLIAKFTTDFHLQSGDDELTSIDETFTYTLDGPTKGYFVTMETFGVPDNPVAPASEGPYGVFSSAKDATTGVVGLLGTIYGWDGSEWLELLGGESEDVGIFISSEDPSEEDSGDTSE